MWAARGRQQDAWQHTSSLLCLLANVNRDPKKQRPFRPRDFDPFSERTGSGGSGNLGFYELKDVFQRGDDDGQKQPGD